MKLFQFFVEVKNELAKVIWPTRKETVRYTVTVILFSLGIAFILGAADLGLLKVFENIIQK
jgi:preprotein translocase subunit SecE